jgi:hypothetical protein
MHPNGLDQIEPAGDHRRWEWLALFERAQTRAEGISGKGFAMRTIQTRRRFLTTLSLAGATGFVGAPSALRAEALMETTAVRLVRDPGICLAPQYAAEELLRVEGLTDIRYLKAASDADTAQIIARGEGDFTLNFASQFVAPIDRGAPITVLAGIHVGCFELFASDAIRGIADLRGKSVGAQSLGSSAQVFLGALAAGYRARPGPRYSLGHRPGGKGARIVRGGQNRRVSRGSAGPAGIVRPGSRPCCPQ